MLVFLSDIHFTDGSSGETIKPAAFRLFVEQLKKLAESVNPLEDIHLVLLGDIFDVIRSAKWLNTSSRPWDEAGSVQQAVVDEIIAGIISNNSESLSAFYALRDYVYEKEKRFSITYITGNHDWLINRYSSSRQLVAKALKLFGDGVAPFPQELFEPTYRVFARHGDIYDSFNYMGNRDASSIGDAIVIELLNKFPLEVEKELAGLVTQGEITDAERTDIFTKLREIDNLRPLLDAPSWVLMVSSRTNNSAAQQVIETTWQKCVNEFFEVPFIKSQDTFLWPDTIDLLQVVLQLSSHTSKKILEKIVELKERFWPDKIEGEYHKAAFAETLVRSGEVDLVLYGHTHNHLILPMDQVARSDGSQRNMLYFNTGTWRKTWNKVYFDVPNREFIGWHVLTYVAIFSPTENGDHTFEVWNGALG